MHRWYNWIACNHIKAIRKQMKIYELFTFGTWIEIMRKERKKMCIRCCNENTIIDAQLYSHVNFIVLILSHLRLFWALDYCTMHASAALISSIALGLMKCIALCLSVIDCLMFICVLATGQSFLHTHFHFQALCLFCISNWSISCYCPLWFTRAMQEIHTQAAIQKEKEKEKHFFLQYQQHKQNMDK